jgi:uncharacterized membrane protein YczE
MRANHAPVELRRRLPRLLLGLVLCGLGIASMVAGDLGLGPWDVLHQGISLRTGIPIGMVNVLVGLGVLALWLPLRERPGLGTLLNAIVIGVVIDLALLVLVTPEALVARILMTLAGPVLFGVGSGFYIGAGLGPGPRDGVMTGLARRGHRIGSVRAVLELTVLLGGWLLGGTVGLGTVAFALGIGPIVHLSLARLAMVDAVEADPPPGVRSAR